jgi:hypothetical protein
VLGSACALLVLVAALAPRTAHAGQTAIQQNPSELSLDAPGGILDQLYGLANLTRVEDFGAFPSDQIWRQVSAGSATARARFASLSHRFGYFANGSGTTFTALFDVSAPSSGILDPGGPTATFTVPSPTFRLALRVLSGSTITNTWSSQESDNGDGRDHLVAWRIAGPGDRYVVAWEDLSISSPSSSEPDFNDLVIELQGVAPDGCGNAAVDPGEQCDGGTCCSASCRFVADGTSCADGNACNGAETCQAGTCTPGAPLVCDDGNVCTDDSCHPATGCVAVPNSAPCNDGNACTVSDVCSGGACTAGAPLVCDDGNVCTDDSCNPATGCVAVPNSAPCNDGNACTVSDACSAGACSGAPRNCNDGNVCTDDSCNPATGCVAMPNSAPCSDGNACTSGDVCSGGSCAPGAPVTCDDANFCTVDSCDIANGCSNVASPTLCRPGEDAPVQPILECVVENGPGDFVAHFGHLNENPVPITIPVGPDNRFSPAPVDRGQTTTFPPGRSGFYPAAAFQVPFDGSPLTWTLGSPDGTTRSTTASAASARCPEIRLLRQTSICYSAFHQLGTPKPPNLALQSLEDLLEARLFNFGVTRGLCAPLAMTFEGAVELPTDLETHLKARAIALSRTTPAQTPFHKSAAAQQDIVVEDAFGTHRLRVSRYERTLLPAAACNPAVQTCPPTAAHLPLDGLATEKFKCYAVSIPRTAPKFPKDVNIVGVDEFQSRVYRVTGPKILCTRASHAGEDPLAASDPEGLLCHALRVPRNYCEPGAPPPHPLRACRNGAQCGGARCVVLPKPLLNAIVPGVQIRDAAAPQNLVTLYPQLVCTPATIAAP